MKGKGWNVSKAISVRTEEPQSDRPTIRNIKSNLSVMIPNTANRAKARKTSHIVNSHKLYLTNVHKQNAAHLHHSLVDVYKEERNEDK